MRKKMLLFVVAGMLLFIVGCMNFEIDGDGDKTTASIHGSETVHGSFYGFLWATHNPTKTSDGLGLYRVEYHTNMLYILASTFSLGLYVPQTVEWWSQDPEGDEDGPLL